MDNSSDYPYSVDMVDEMKKGEKGKKDSERHQML